MANTSFLMCKSYKKNIRMRITIFKISFDLGGGGILSSIRSEIMFYSSNMDVHPDQSFVLSSMDS